MSSSTKIDVFAGHQAATGAEARAEHHTEVYAFPMSFSQQRLWLLEQLEPGNPAYNLAAAVQLRGSLDLPSLDRSFNEIVRRHETLRTTFGLDNGEPAQLVAADSRLELAVLDLEQLNPDRVGAELEQHIKHETLRPFNLSTGPLIRITLLRQAEQVHTLLIVMHHIISDGWSMGALCSELSALYNAFSRQQESPLPELEIQYADYSAWQREWLAGPQLRRQLQYWQKHLAGAPAHLELTTDRPRPATQSFEGATVRLEIERSLRHRLETLCAEAGATSTMGLLAGLFVLLRRYSTDTEIVVGTPVANRRRSEIEGLIGLFVNTLPIRADLSGDPSFRELLAQVRETSLDAWANQDLPFEQLVEAVQPQRDLSRSPLFQVMFIVQNAPVGDLELDGLEVRPLELDGHTAKYDLTLSLHETPDGLSGILEHSSELLDVGTAQSMADCYTTLLADATTRPDAPISDLSTITEDQLSLLSNRLGSTDARLPEATVSELIQRHAQTRPGSIAIVSGDQRLSYQQLDARSSMLAARLRRQGAGSQVAVGICLERSAQLAVALLATLKAGAPFVPLDPSFPGERLAMMLEDCSAQIVICEPATAHLVPQRHAVELLVLDPEPAEARADEPAPRPTRAPGADELAYVIFTSGSTGRPKGVQVTHQGLLNLLQAMARRPGLDETDVLLAVTTISFDISVLELLLPLAQGARLVIAHHDQVRDAERLGQLIETARATVMQATPATWRMLVASGWRGSPSLKILSGGEALPGDLADALLARSASVWNMYGPTETTIWSAVHRVVASDTALQSLPLGTAIDSTRLCILDESLRPVPQGAEGELLIGGLGLARGYIGQAGKTAERFVPDPFSSTPGSRLYRTGDRARYRADGSIEYLGRLDHQVKLRGYRIELGEIEAVLRRHAAVTEAAATIVVQPSGEARLVAFVVSRPGNTPTASELSDHLRQHLPDYMVPAQIELVSSLPLTANGKLDRKALRQLRVSPPRTTAPLLPRDAVEHQLVDVWREVLEHPGPGVRQSFFELGGHSLLAVRLITEIRQRLGLELPLSALFRHPTIEGMASVVRAAQSRGGSATISSSIATAAAGLGSGDLAGPLVPLAAQAGSTPFFCAPGAGGDPSYMAGLARVVGEDRSFWAFRAPGLDQGARTMTSVEALAEHYLRALKGVQPSGPYLLGGHSFGSRVAFELSQRLLDQGQEVALLLVFDTVAPVIKSPTASWSEADLMADLATIFTRLTGSTERSEAPELADLPARQRLDLAWRQLEKSGAFGAGIGTRTLRRLVDVYTTNLGIEYIASDSRPVPIVLLRAAEQIPWTGDRPDELTRVLAEPDWGWGRLAAGEVEVIEVPGDHLSLFHEPHLSRVGELITPLLTRAALPATARWQAPATPIDTTAAGNA